MSKAADKRYEALQAVNNRVVTANADGKDVTWHTEDREEIASMIRELTALGRTERWSVAVETWAVMVLDQENPLSWAFFQGGIWCSHAAE